MHALVAEVYGIYQSAYFSLSLDVSGKFVSFPMAMFEVLEQ